SFYQYSQHLTRLSGTMVYNHLLECWRYYRFSNTSAGAFGLHPLAHVHQELAYLAVMLAGPRAATLAAPPAPPRNVLAYGQPHDESPATALVRDASVPVATDDWPFLYMRAPALP